MVELARPHLDRHDSAEVETPPPSEQDLLDVWAKKNVLSLGAQMSALPVRNGRANI